MPPEGFLPPPDESEEKVRFSIRLERPVAHLFPLMAKAWNEVDSFLGRKRSRQWSGASCIEHLLEVYARDFAAEVGGPQAADESDEEFVKRAVAELRKRAKR